MNHYQLISDQFLQYLKSDVDVSTSLGLPDNLHRLGDPGLATSDAQVTAAQQLLAQIDETQVIDFHQALDLRLIRRHLQKDIFFKTLTINGAPQRRQRPGGVDGISAGIFQLFVNDEREAPARLQDILSRLRQAPAYLQAELAVLTRPIKRWRSIEAEQAEELPGLFSAIVDWAREVEFDSLVELAAEVERTNEALRAYCNALQAMPTANEFAIGRDKVEELLAIQQIERSPEQLRQMAADYMVETAQAIEELRERLVSKYELEPGTDAATLQEFLNNRFAVHLEDGKLSSILNVYQQERENILAFSQARDLFPIPDDQDMHIMETPTFLQPVIPAGAMWPPLALREGTKKSIVYLTLKEGELGEHTHLGICTMMIHEGIPGHHLQLASAAGHDSLVRRVFDAPEHAEGWTTMLEDYMLDIGYVENDLVDEVRFIAKRDISRLVARVGIDLYFMTADKHFLNVGLDLDFSSDDPFENAGLLLKEATGFSDGRVQAELNWYSTEQGYPLSYLTGNRLVWELKRDLVRNNTGRLNEQELDAEFHRIYLQSGCMPVASLREVFAEEGML